MVRDDPKVVGRVLLREEWNSGNTLGFTPDVRTGWRDSTLDHPLVTWSHDEEGAEASSGYTGMSGSGKPTSRRTGTVQVNIWADEDVVDANPKKAVEAMRDEVERILYEHGSEIAAYAFPAGAPVTADEYEYLSYQNAQHMPEDPDTDEEPVIQRYRVVAAYEYLREPTS